MSDGVIPLRLKGDDRSILARIDPIAAELLSTGQAANLQAARIAAILMDLRTQRDLMTTLLAELRSRDPTGFPQIDAANADLAAAINQGIVQIDLFIAHARSLPG